MERAFGVSVTLERGGEVTSSFTARRGEREHMVIGLEYGIPTQIKMQYYKFDKDSADFGSGAVEPQTGDRITEGTETYELMPPNNDTPAVQEENGGHEWIVHVKKVD